VDPVPIEYCERVGRNVYPPPVDAAAALVTLWRKFTWTIPLLSKGAAILQVQV
jgi:hypothetical protein